MNSKRAAKKITDIIEKYTNNKCKCIYIEDVWNGLSISINNEFIHNNKYLISEITNECNIKYGGYIQSYELITPTLFNIYFHNDIRIREKKISKLKSKLLVA